MTERQRFRIRVTRNGVLFVAGLAGVLHEASRAGPERPTLLLLYAGMMGLPGILALDRQRGSRDDRKEDADGHR
jgi:hypothetical protein